MKRMRRRILVAANASEFSEKGARLFMENAVRSVHEKGIFLAALSGGSTPRPVHRRLAEAPYRALIPWERTHLFWVDERMVAHSHPASNFGRAMEDLIQHIPIPEDHLHPMPLSGPMEARADQYESELGRFSRQGDQKGALFDLVFAGLGPDGHIASLFPGTPALSKRQRRTTLVRGGNPDLWRLTLTLEAINATRCLCFLISGRRKASVVARVLVHRDHDLPAQQVHPAGGETVFLLDMEAAALLPQALYDSMRSSTTNPLKP